MFKEKSPTPAKKNEKQLSFPRAMTMLIGGGKIRRVEWNDADEYCLLKDSYLMIHRGGKFHTWIVSEGDLLASDWVIVKHE